MTSNETVWFKSKLDWPIGLILVTVPLIQVAVMATTIATGNMEGIVANLIGLAFVAGIYVLLVLPVRYAVADDTLLVHFGVVRQRIRFDAIREVYPTHSLLSSPALSLDRLAITTGPGPLHLTLISPLDREEFLSLLSMRAGLMWDGRRWVHKESSPRA